MHKEIVIPLNQSEQRKPLYAQMSTYVVGLFNCSYSDTYKLTFNAIVLCIDRRKCIEKLYLR